MNGALVRKWMKDQGMRPEELAVKLDVSFATVQNILAGKKVYSSTIGLLSHLTGIPLEDLKGAPKGTTRKRVAQAV